MRKLRGMAPLIAGAASSLVFAGCARELTLEEPARPDEVVVAQFDPTNPIPVLQIVPSPTALAENPEGGLNVVPQPCEGPSPKTCLGLFDAWPVTTPITLYFSGELDVDTVKSSIKLVKSPALGTPIDYDFEISDRPPPPDECFAGGNGSMPERGFTAAQVVPGVQLVITPSQPLDPGSLYIIYVENTLMSADGKPVEPSNLFALMNVPEEAAPIQVVDGQPQITSALLRSNVQSLVLAGLFPGRTLDQLSEDERDQLDAAVSARAAPLQRLYGFFNMIITPLEATGASSRDKLVLVNAWHTSDAPADPAVTVGFDPARQIVPFPNVQLLTTTTAMGLRVNLPINPCGATPTPGCDSPTSAALKGGLNTLNGFSTTASISVSFTGEIDPSSLAGNVAMFEVNDQGAIVGNEIPVNLGTIVEENGTTTLTIRPVNPLDQNTTYVVGLKRGIRDSDGGEVGRPSTFNLLTSEQPLVVNGMVNAQATVGFGGNPAVPVASLLTCSQLSTTGMLLSEEQVLETASAVEFQLMRARWQEAITALDGTPFSGDDLLLAWTYRTQDITGLVDQVKLQLLPTVWQQVRTATNVPELAGPVARAVGRAQISAFLDIPNNFCLRACQGGLMGAGLIPGAPVIPPDMCTEMDGTATSSVASHPVCGLFTDLLIGRLGSVSVYAMATYQAIGGNPLVPGQGTFSPARIGQPRIEQQLVYVTRPAGTATVPAAIFQHGLGRMAQDGFLIANSLAGAGFATVMMDLPFHGSRASDILNNATGVPCPAVDPAMVACDPMSRACVGGCDGQQDPSGAGFLSANIFAARDNFRQSTIDQLTLLRAIQEQSGSGEPLAGLDASEVGYIGQSLGGITGGNFIAYAPELSAAVLNVPGGGLVNILLGTVPQISAPLFAGLAAAGVCELNVPGNPAGGCRNTPGFRQFTTIAQWVLDPGDPLANSIGVLAPHNGIEAFGAEDVLVQMAVPDLVIPNSTTLDLGMAYGFNPDDNSETSHFQTFEFMPIQGPQNCHGFLLDITGAGCQANPIGAICTALGSQAQAARFLASGGMTVGPRRIALPPLCQ